MTRCERCGLEVPDHLQHHPGGTDKYDRPRCRWTAVGTLDQERPYKPPADWNKARRAQKRADRERIPSAMVAEHLKRTEP